MKFGKIIKSINVIFPINIKQQETIDKLIKETEQNIYGDLIAQSERFEFNFNMNVHSAWESSRKGWLSISITANKDLNNDGGITEFISGYIKTNGSFQGKINRNGIPKKLKKYNNGGNINNFKYTIGGL